MHDTGSVSTFEKYVLGTGTLSDKQLESCRDIQTFLRNVGIEKTLEEIVLVLKLKTPDEMGKILADIKAKWQIAIPKPRVFSISSAQDEQLQKTLVDKGPAMAKNVVECRKIADGLAKFGLTMTVSEIIIAKGYYTPASMRSDEPTLEAAPTTEEVNIRRVQDAETAEEKPVKKSGSGLRPAVGAKKPGSGIRPGVREPERYKPESAADQKAQQKKTLLFSLIGVAAVVIIAVAVMVTNQKPEPSEKESTESAKKEGTTASTTKKETPPEKKDVPPAKEPEKKPEEKKDDFVLPDYTKKPEPKKDLPELVPMPSTAPKPPPKDSNPTPPAPKDPPSEPDPKPQDPPDGPPPSDGPPVPKQDAKETKKQDRENKANNLWTGAQELFNQGKFADSQDALRELRERFLDTKIYWDNKDAVEEMFVNCGYKVAATGLVAQKLYDKNHPHMDTILGFQVNPPAGWRGIPNWQDFFGETDTSEQKYRGQTYRCGRYTSRWLETLYIVVYKTYAPNGIAEVMEGSDKYMVQSPFTNLKETAAGPFNGVHQGMRKLQVDDDGNRIAVYGFMSDSPKKGFGLACYWRTSNDDFIRIKDKKNRPPTDEEWAAAVKVFDQVAKTFFIMDQPTLSASRGMAKSWGINSTGWCVKCSDWNVLTSKSGQYVIEYATRKEFADRLGRELDNINSLYRRIIPSSSGMKCRVKLFDTEEDFQYYGQAWGAAAYWSPSQEEIVAYRFSGTKVKLRDSGEDMTIAEEKNPEEVTFNIIYHEAFHQYMYYLMGRERGVYVPSWLNEGMGDYFFGGRWLKNGKFEIGYNDWRLETILAAVKENKHVPLKDIIRYTQQDYYSRAGLCYAEGWSMNYFFMSDIGRKNGYDKIPVAMFNALQKSGSGEGWKKATDSAFAGYDLAKMEAEWKAFVLGLEKLLPPKKEPGKQ